MKRRLLLNGHRAGDVTSFSFDHEMTGKFPMQRLPILYWLERLQNGLNDERIATQRCATTALMPVPKLSIEAGAIAPALLITGVSEHGFLNDGQ